MFSLLRVKLSRTSISGWTHTIAVFSASSTWTWNFSLTEMLKSQVIKIVGKTAKGTDYELTRMDKFQVFRQVCDGLLKEGRITPAKHKQWTEIW